MRFRKWLPWFLAGLYYLAAALAATWPLALNMGHSEIGWIGDNYYFTWVIMWVRRALFDLYCSPFHVAFVNYPEGASLACNEMTPVMTLMGLACSSFHNSVFGYNCAIVLSFVLSGLAMHAWIWRMTGSHAAALVSATIFALSPCRISRLPGHLNLLGTQWLPLYFMGLTMMLDGRGARKGPAVLCGVMLGLNALTAPYYLYMTAVMSLALVVWHWLANDRRLMAEKWFWRCAVTAALAALPLTIAGMWPYLQLAGEGALQLRGIEEARRWCASPQDYFIPGSQRFLWGAYITWPYRRLRTIENVQYLGLVTYCLVIVSLVMRRFMPGKQWVVPMLLAAGTAMILSFGPNLHWMWKPVRMDVPAFMREMLGRETVLLRLPGYYLFKYAPFYSAMRVSARYGVYVNLFMAALAGMGCAALLERFPRAARWAAPGLLAIVLIDFLPESHFMVRFGCRPVDRWLAAQPAGAIAQFPFHLSSQAEHVVYAWAADKPTIGGYFSSLPPQYKSVYPILANYPGKEGDALLKRLGVRYAVFDSRFYDDFLKTRSEVETLGWRFLKEIGGQYVFESP
ncbi:MAG: hypothetical protein NTY46_03755 [Candidatus Sumerlaeota bacterium]|nr:hypothetical protein [Candidatus Sumerlaeota bacterium]